VVVETIHGTAVHDPFRALEDAASNETISWCADQDARARSYLDALPGREEIRSRVRELMRIGIVSAPAIRRGRLFFYRREGDQEHAILYVREPDGAERVLIDPSTLSDDLTTTLDFVSPSFDGKRLAYGLSEAGDEEATLYVMDVDTLADLGERIDRTRYSPVAWLPGSESFYYVRRLPPSQVPAGEEQFHRRVYLHTIGSSDDVEIFGAGRDHRSYYGASVSPDGRWLIVSATIGTDRKNDLYIADLAGDAQLRPVIEGADAQTYGSVRDGVLYLWTNLDAPKGRLVVADPSAPTEWRTLVPESDAVMSGWTLAGGRLLVDWDRDATSRLTVHDLSSGEQVREVDMPALGSFGVTSDPEGGDDAFIPYTSFTTPPQVFRYDVRSGDIDVWARAGDFDGSRFDVKQVFYSSKDGTRVPMFVVHAKDTPLDGTAPGIITGYGGFKLSNTPAFLGSYVRWLEAGGVYALANLRGGDEYGEEWHRAGMLGNKQNVFDDFLAGAEYLISSGFVAPGRLAAVGGSNGGLLVGAALTQRPDLFRAIVCSAPLLDMVRYEKFGLGRTWNVEYGSADVAEEFEWLHGYSPYHRVEDGVAYPAVLFTTFESDTRVDPLHARKMCARLQEANASSHPILLRRETKAGHAAKSVSRSVDQIVDVQAFLSKELGVS
jgi:prolyl oligopeptidase